MKIKEVIEKTGLTDRAIRLYIDEGLAAPSIEESYSGRKSIEFSPADVERLNNVAMLRKAGFSIADIKSIVDDKATAKNIVGKFIEQTEENIKHESEIVEKLKSISFDKDVTIETICESLSATVEENEVPSEDMKLTTIEIFVLFFCKNGSHLFTTQIISPLTGNDALAKYKMLLYNRCSAAYPQAAAKRIGINSGIRLSRPALFNFN